MTSTSYTTSPDPIPLPTIAAWEREHHPTVATCPLCDAAGWVEVPGPTLTLMRCTHDRGKNRAAMWRAHGRQQELDRLAREDHAAFARAASARSRRLAAEEAHRRRSAAARRGWETRRSRQVA
ncbi:hypothetical protein HMPREF2651_10360 [Corynebacterium sp. HMSC063A05]|uniref:hypothetical protein n=1 Tax=unclassified Corynebacterium TaxID=2624378 RepID=UPI0006686A77|nr:MULTISPECIES: hypothetical protein [unclassified Corynebacterium]OFM83398.1 hypothetical protein HMPREF2651_10360 [Corynebacterium sp. HMSC063A05]